MSDRIIPTDGLDPATAALIQRARDSRPLYVNPNGDTFSFRDPARAAAIAAKHGGHVIPASR